MEQVYTHVIWKFGKANMKVEILYPKPNKKSGYLDI
jgi:hypothetical protein